MLCDVDHPGAGAVGIGGLLSIMTHDIICDSKSGVRERGKKPTQNTHFVEVADNLRAYSVFEHRHTRRDSGATGIGGGERDFYAAPVADSARNACRRSICSLKKKATAAEIEDRVEEVLCGIVAWVRIFAAGKLPQIGSFHSGPIIAMSASRWVRTASGSSSFRASTIL